VQTLPLLEKAYPQHWVFNEHLLFKDEDGLADLNGLWDRWAQLALLATSSVREHLRLAQSVHGADACPPFMPNRQLAVLAADFGATWATDRVSSLATMDPIGSLLENDAKVDTLCLSDSRDLATVFAQYMQETFRHGSWARPSSVDMKIISALFPAELGSKTLCPWAYKNDNAALSVDSSIVIRGLFKLFVDTASCLHMMLICDTGARTGQTAERTAGDPNKCTGGCEIHHI
jgi:hypothetical protein